jgi:hypothetical protein
MAMESIVILIFSAEMADGRVRLRSFVTALFQVLRITRGWKLFKLQFSGGLCQNKPFSGS